MRIWKKSKLPTLCTACGVLLAVFLPGSSQLLAYQIAALTEQNGQTVYVNANPASAPTSQTEPGQLLSSPTEFNSIIQRVSSRYKVDPKLIHAMIRVESDYDPQAVSSKGAMGLMQLIPSTARRFGVQNPFDPSQNIRGGVSYLKYLLHLFGGNVPLSLAAYNAGEETVIRSGGIPAIPETEHYVRAITHLYHSKNASLMQATATNKLPPIVRYVDAQGVIHFTNAE